MVKLLGKKIDMKIPPGQKKKLEEAIDTITKFYDPITEQIRIPIPGPARTRRII